MKYEFCSDLTKCEFYYFENINSIFIRTLVGDSFSHICSMINNYKIDCFVTLSDFNSLSYFIENGFIDTKCLNNFYLLYKGDRTKLFSVLYYYYKEIFNKDPFYNKEFRKLAFSINESKSYRTDNLILF